MAEAVRPQQRMKKKVKRKKEKLEDSITKPEASKSSWFVEEDDVKQPGLQVLVVCYLSKRFYVVIDGPKFHEGMA